jgi:hypothetical protein
MVFRHDKETGALYAAPARCTIVVQLDLLTVNNVYRFNNSEVAIE